MSIFIIKIIACITMICDHIRYAIPITNNNIIGFFGRMSFPLFAFSISEGYLHTKNLNKYFNRLLVLALISEIPFVLFRTIVGDYLMLNICFTFLLGLSCIVIYENIQEKYLSIPIIILISYIGYLIKVDYGWYGIITVFLFYISKHKKIYIWISFFLLNIIYFYTKDYFKNIDLQIILSFIGIMSSLIIITLYNGKKGKNLKYFFYCFYPIHMLIFYLINKFI